MSANRQTIRRTSASRRRSGFTLIEILIVVVILGILAAIMVPNLTSASREAKESMLRDDLRTIRHQLAIFKAQHRDVSAGFPNGDVTAAPAEATLVDHMTLYSSEGGATSATQSATHRYGPYMSKFPINPLTNKAGVWVVLGPLPTADETRPYGWIYNPATNKIIPNLVGNDLLNQAYTSY